MFLKERMEGICIFFPLQCIIKEFKESVGISVCKLNTSNIPSNFPTRQGEEGMGTGLA